MLRVVVDSNQCYRESGCGTAVVYFWSPPEIRHQMDDLVLNWTWVTKQKLFLDELCKTLFIKSSLFSKKTHTS